MRRNTLAMGGARSPKWRLNTYHEKNIGPARLRGSPHAHVVRYLLKLFFEMIIVVKQIRKDFNGNEFPSAIFTLPYPFITNSSLIHLVVTANDFHYSGTSAMGTIDQIPHFAFLSVWQGNIR